MVVENGLEYTRAALESVKTKYPYKIVIIDNYSTDGTKEWLASRKDIHSVIDPEGSTGLAYNWNLGIKEATRLRCNRFLMLSNDILLHSEYIDNLMARYDKGDVTLMSGYNIECDYPEQIFFKEIESFDDQPNAGFSCFMLSTDTIDKIGWLDENIRKIYWEDVDYATRIELAGEKHIVYRGSISYHYGSATLNRIATPEQQNEIHRNYALNQEYIMRKWGNDSRITKEIYQTPWNIENKSIKECNES